MSPAPDRPKGPAWVSITAYAALQAVSRKTVYKWLEAGLLITYRVGRLIRVRNQPPIEQKPQNYHLRKQDPPRVP